MPRQPLKPPAPVDHDPVPPEVWWGRCLLWGLMGVWFFQVWKAPMTEPPPLLHLTVILFHEAGHVIFSPLGEVVGVAGGTLGQLLMPLTCAVSFWRRDDRFAAALCLLWTALSLIDSSFYAWDAADPLLPLIGGGTGADRFHDFIFLFERFHQLDHAHAWARAMHAVGLLVGLAALADAGRVLWLQRAGHTA